MKPLVYIAGPYTHPDPVQNTHRAIREGMRLRETHQVAVLIPHLNLLADMVEPRPVDYWYQWDLDQLGSCDVLYRMPGLSTGADNEVAYAIEHDIPVVYNDDGLLASLRVRGFMS